MATLKEEEQKKIINRLAKAHGHLKSVRTMVENGRDCSEVLIQLSAVRAALTNISREILKSEIDSLCREAYINKNKEAADNLEKIIERMG